MICAPPQCTSNDDTTTLDYWLYLETIGHRSLYYEMRPTRKGQIKVVTESTIVETYWKIFIATAIFDLI